MQKYLLGDGVQGIVFLTIFPGTLMNIKFDKWWKTRICARNQMHLLFLGLNPQIYHL